MQLHLDKKDILEKLSSVVIAAYVVTAMAFECTPNTSRYSTLGIYAVFLIGVLYIFVRKNIKLNAYVFSLYFMYAYILLMGNASGASSGMGQEIPYLYLTCAIVCYIVYCVTYSYSKLVYFLVWGLIVGALVLAYRITQAYGGLSMMLKFASMEGERRVGGDIINENTLGLYMSNALLCCILFLFVIKKRKKMLFIALLPCSGIFVAMSLLSGSKKAIAFLIIGICVLIWLFTKGVSIEKKLMMFLGTVLLVIVIVHSIRTLPFFATINTRIEELSGALTGNSGAVKTDLNRIYMSKMGLNAFAKKPIFGNGTGHSYNLFNTYSHNNFVELLMNYGIVGFGLYYLPYLILVTSLYQQSKKGNRFASYFLAYTILQIGLGIGWVNYYERVIQVVSAAAWGYIDHLKDKGE